jgi:hypothetical protein
MICPASVKASNSAERCINLGEALECIIDCDYIFQLVRDDAELLVDLDSLRVSSASLTWNLR